MNFFQEEMKRRAEEARKRKLEEKAREKERKKEEKKLLTEVMADWKKTRYKIYIQDCGCLGFRSFFF
jgi:hypothetical protein